MSKLFKPNYGGTKTINVSTTASEPVMLDALTGVSQVEIYNDSGALVFYKLGEPNVEATATDAFLPSKGTTRITRSRTETHISILAASGSGKVYVAQERGIRAPKAPSLKERAAGKGLVFGAEVMKSYLLDSPEYEDYFKEECGLLVPGNELKWGYLRPNASAFDFDRADWLIDFAEDAGIPVHGHTLVWGDALPEWVASTINAGNAEQYMTDHITTVVGRYAGRVQSWDVTNEAIVWWDGRADGLGANIWLNNIGPGYVKLAFDTAHAADPNARLVFNQNYLEYNTSSFMNAGGGFRTKTLAFLEGLLNAGAPVHALGIQGHLYAHDGPFDPVSFRTFLSDVASLGLEIMVTEMDVRDADLPASVQSRDLLVAEQYREFLDVVLDEPAVTTITTWGLSDKYSWLKDFGTRPDGLPVRPLPLDSSFKRKLAWRAIADAFDRAPARPA